MHNCNHLIPFVIFFTSYKTMFVCVAFIIMFSVANKYVLGCYESDGHHSLDNTTFAVRGWGWGDLRAGVLCLIHLSSQAVLHGMNGSMGVRGGGGALRGRLTPAIVLSYCWVPT